MKKIRKGDEVIIIAGESKRKRGIVLAMHGEWATVEGMKLVKKHVKPNPTKGISGGVEVKSMPIHVSNMALVDANGKGSRVSIKVLKDGKKYRVLKTTGAELK